jgi:putative inorganic carbon (hco3(-)) transporter
MSVYNYLKTYFTEILITSLAFILFIITFYWHFWLIWLILAVVLFVYLISYKLDWCLYLLVLTFPFINWQIYITRDLNLPPVDLIVIILLIAYIINGIRNKTLLKTRLPFIFLFGSFFILAGLSLFNSYFLDISLKYLLRPIIFSYLMFVVLPVNIIKNEKILKNIIWLIFGIGILISLTGLFSVGLNYFIYNSFPRATPLGIGNFWPIGNNQNLIAEILVMIIPLGFVMNKLRHKNDLNFYLINLGILLMVVVDLLTFSRAGWLVLIAELIILAVLFLNKKILRFLISLLPILLIIILPLLFLMFSLTQSHLTFSSNQNRILQWQTGWEMLKHNPILGAGPGTFMEILNHDPYYLFEFGTGIDAHGVILKVMSELGILGLISFIILIITIFTKTIKRLKEMIKYSDEFLILSCLTIGAAAAFTFQLFNTSYYTVKLWLPIGLMLSAFYLYAKRTEN